MIAMTDKGFSVEAVQTHRALVAENMIGNRYRHHEGGLYQVVRITVLKSTGVLLVSYACALKCYEWTCALEEFNACINPTKENPDGVPRFARVS